MDHLMSMMEKYSSNLEKQIEIGGIELKKEKKMTEKFLYNMLPR